MAKVPPLGPNSVSNKNPPKFGAATKMNATSFKLKGQKATKTKSVRKKKNMSAKSK